VTAIGLYRRLMELGLQPGKDLAVVGFRDEPTLRFLMPSVTCFHVSLPDLGASIARALLAQIPAYSAGYPEGVVQRRVPLTLRPGDSDAYAPSEAVHAVGEKT
jgi:DNA-binding LacI/PurR family transcriptional regulator